MNTAPQCPSCGHCIPLTSPPRLGQSTDVMRSLHWPMSGQEGPNVVSGGMVERTRMHTEIGMGLTLRQQIGDYYGTMLVRLKPRGPVAVPSPYDPGALQDCQATPTSTQRRTVTNLNFWQLLGSETRQSPGEASLQDSLISFLSPAARRGGSHSSSPEQSAQGVVFKYY